MNDLNSGWVIGEKHRQTYASHVIAILGEDAPPVYSRGDKFYNVNRWTTRFFIGALCEWAKEHPKEKPTESLVRSLVNKVNNDSSPTPHIVIARTPDVLPSYMALALVGGAYHEAFHTLYSGRKDLKTGEVWDIISNHWDEDVDWGSMAPLLLTLSNLVEDIRIEQLGCKEFPGVTESLANLQDFILIQERQGKELRAHNTSEKKGSFTVMMSAFRDMGLGYKTQMVSDAWASYEDSNKESVLMVTQGPLRPLVIEAQSLSPEDVHGCLRIAMKIVSLLKKTIEETKQEQKQEQEDMFKCPECQAEGDKIVVRPKMENGVKVKGVGVCTCDCCGHSWEIPLAGISVQKGSSESDGDNKKAPRFEGFDMDDFTPSSSWVEDLKDNMSDKNMPQTEMDALNSVLNTMKPQVKEGENYWNPYTQEHDEVQPVTPKGEAHDILLSVQRECAYNRAKLLSMVQVLEQKTIKYGSAKGNSLSSRHLVQSFVEMKSGKYPTKPFVHTTAKPSLSMASVVILDESGSMSSWRHEATKIMLSIAEPLSHVKSPVACIGFGDAQKSYSIPVTEKGDFHRYEAIRIRIFKTLEESFRATLPRFSNTIAEGGTPLAEGLQYALESLSHRKEANKFIFVVTDGEATSAHDVIRWQMRTAKEAGIHIIGIGIGNVSENLKSQFHNFVCENSVSDIPRSLMKLLSDIVMSHPDSQTKIFQSPVRTKFQL